MIHLKIRQKKLVNPSQYADFEGLGGQHNCNPSPNDVHNSSFSDCTDNLQPLDNSINSGLTNPKTVIIENNIQDHISNTDTDSPKLETTEIVHVGTKDDCSILIKIGERNRVATF